MSFKSTFFKKSDLLQSKLKFNNDALCRHIINVMVNFCFGFNFCSIRFVVNLNCRRVVKRSTWINSKFHP